MPRSTKHSEIYRLEPSDLELGRLESVLGFELDQLGLWLDVFLSFAPVRLVSAQSPLVGNSTQDEQ